MQLQSIAIRLSYHFNMAHYDDDVLKATMFCTFILFLKMFAVYVGQGGAKGKAGLRPPEDAGMVSNWKKEQGFQAKLDGSEETKKAAERVDRWNRVVMNDLENIPIALILAWGSVLSGVGRHGEGLAVVYIIALCLFTVMRVLHTISFVYSLQPWRTIAYMVGMISIFVIGVCGLAAAFE